MQRLMFLPGASGASQFWLPVAGALPPEWDKVLLSWPGLGREAHDRSVQGLEDLVSLVLERLNQPADLVAQSMGGLVALKTVLRAPGKVRRLVLTGTSGGLPVCTVSGSDWRSTYRLEYPSSATWITEVEEDLSEHLHRVRTPTLLLWGDQDDISPVAVGERLENVLPNATLRIVPGGRHDFPKTHAQEVADHILEHLR